MRQLFVAVLFPCFLLCCATHPETLEAKFVPLNELASKPEEFLAMRVQTQGCIIYHVHGSYLSPCGDHTWREILLTDDARNFSSYQEVAKFVPNPMNSPYGRFYGVIKKRRSEVNPSKTVYFLMLDRLDSVSSHEP